MSEKPLDIMSKLKCHLESFVDNGGMSQMSLTYTHTIELHV